MICELGEHRLRIGVAGLYMKPPYIGGKTLGVSQTGPIEPPPEKIFHRRGGDVKVPGNYTSTPHYSVIPIDVSQRSA